MSVNFDHPEALIALWLLPLLAFILWKSLRSQITRLKLYGGGRLQDLLSHKISRRRSGLKSTMILIAVTLLIIAASRPQWGFEWREVPQGGTDLMVALDVSTSMLANDIPPSRLERAKREIIDLLNMLEGDRLGIVAFAGIPFVQCPLTTDHKMIEIFVKNIDTNLIPVQGTDLGAAIKSSVSALEKGSESESDGKALILITDGEDQDGKALAEAKIAKEKGIRIFVIGIGKKDGAPIPIPGGGYKKDKYGNMIISKLDEESLEKIAIETGGTYVRSTTGDLDLDVIYRNGIRKELKDQNRGELRQKIWHERFQWPLGSAIIILMLEILISGYKPKHTNSERSSNISIQKGGKNVQ